MLRNLMNLSSLTSIPCRSSISRPFWDKSRPPICLIWTVLLLAHLASLTCLPYLTCLKHFNIFFLGLNTVARTSTSQKVHNKIIIAFSKFWNANFKSKLKNLNLTKRKRKRRVWGLKYSLFRGWERLLTLIA